jgi:hypothetical protein
MKILSQSESKKRLPLCDNAECATSGAMDLPDGHRDAERVMVSKNRKSGRLTYSVTAPWCLRGIF